MTYNSGDVPHQTRQRYTNSLCILYYYSFARESIREEGKEGHIPREENDNTCKKKNGFFQTFEQSRPTHDCSIIFIVVYSVSTSSR